MSGPLVHHGISEKLVETERCLKVGECLCDEAVVSKLAVIHDLRRMDRGHALQCHRPVDAGARQAGGAGGA